MEKIIKTKVYVLGEDIDTDQIIPAQYLAISLSDSEERKRYGGLALCGVPQERAGLPNGNIPFSDKQTNLSPYGIIIASRNFGCGSSREHAPVALAEAGVKAVIATSYARIFYRNAIDGGYFPPFESEEDLTKYFNTGDDVILDVDAARIENVTAQKSYSIRDLGAAGDIIFSGGLFAYARKQGLAGR